MYLNFYEIIERVCQYYNISLNEFDDNMNDKERKFIVLLLLKNYSCVEKKELVKLFRVNNWRSISSSIKRAEEKFFINREFRERYFSIEDSIEKNEEKNKKTLDI